MSDHAQPQFDQLQVLRDENAQLKATNGLLRDLFEHAGDALFLHDLNGKLVDMNRRACHDSGYTREEPLRLSVSDLNLAYE